MFTRNSSVEPKTLEPRTARITDTQRSITAPSSGEKSVIGNDLKIIGQELMIISRGMLQADDVKLNTTVALMEYYPADLDGERDAALSVRPKLRSRVPISTTSLASWFTSGRFLRAKFALLWS